MCTIYILSLQIAPIIGQSSAVISHSGQTDPSSTPTTDNDIGGLILAGLGRSQTTSSDSSANTNARLDTRNNPERLPYRNTTFASDSNTRIDTGRHSAATDTRRCHYAPYCAAECHIDLIRVTLYAIKPAHIVSCRNSLTRVGQLCIRRA